MGDSKRRRTISDNYCLKPQSVERRHLLAGATAEIERYFQNHYEDSVSQRKIDAGLRKLFASTAGENVIKQQDRVILADTVNLAEFTIASLDDWLKVVESLADLYTPNTISELKQILAKYNPDREIIVISSVSTGKGHTTSTEKNFLSITLVRFEYQNIYQYN